jgi:hypothetical protein
MGLKVAVQMDPVEKHRHPGGFHLCADARSTGAWPFDLFVYHADSLALRDGTTDRIRDRT